MNYFKKVSGALGRKKFLFWGIFAVLLLATGFFVLNGEKPTDGSIVVSHSDFINQVSVSGKVVAAEEVDLGFTIGGMVKNIFASVGERVNRGTSLAKIDAKEAEENLRQAEISLLDAKLSLEKLQVESSKENMSADLKSAYDRGYTAVSDAFLDLSSIVVGLEDVLDDSSLSYNVARISGNTALRYREEAEKAYYKAQNAFKINRKSFALLARNSSGEAIEEGIVESYETVGLLYDALKVTKKLADYLENESENSDLASLGNELVEFITDINPHFADLLSAQTSIKSYKDAFTSADLEIKDLLLSIKEKEKLSDYYIRAPFPGVVTKTDAKVGEIVSSNTPVVTLMSADTFQIESFIPEINIARVKLEEDAKITLDAYGEDALFYAKVVSIDPAETVRDGVSTYKVKLQFSEADSRIKSGMTANVSIVVFKKENVIVMPRGVIFERDGKKFVQVERGKEISDREVTLGEVSALGQIEISSGLSDGEVVLLNPKQ